MYNFIKRLFDVAFSFLILLILSPILIPIVIALRLTGEGYVFYYQKRIGYQQKYFNIIKFATMLKDSPNLGTGLITLRNDPRLTPMGGFLRKSKINELPQILNVLIGDMSIVGPRPLVDRTFNAYNEDVKKRVYTTKPGITGIGSIIFRDEEKIISDHDGDPHKYYAEVIAPYKGELEIWYIKNKGFVIDSLIVFLTAWVIIFSKSELTYKLFSDLPKRKF